MFGKKEVSIMFDRAIMKIAEVGSCTSALESLEDIRKFLQIRFLGQFVKHHVFSQEEAERMYYAQ